MTRSPERERPLPADLERMAEEQAALRRVATLVARGATEQELAAAVAGELGHLFSSQAGSVLRWDGDTIRTIDGNHLNSVARAARPHSDVAGGIHIPEQAALPPAPEPYWVIAGSENGKRVLLFSKFATEKQVLGLLPRLFAKYGRAGVTIKRGKERGQ